MLRIGSRAYTMYTNECIRARSRSIVRSDKNQISLEFLFSPLRSRFVNPLKQSYVDSLLLAVGIGDDIDKLRPFSTDFLVFLSLQLLTLLTHWKLFRCGQREKLNFSRFFVCFFFSLKKEYLNDRYEWQIHRKTFEGREDETTEKKWKSKVVNIERVFLRFVSDRKGFELKGGQLRIGFLYIHYDEDAMHDHVLNERHTDTDSSICTREFNEIC